MRGKCAIMGVGETKVGHVPRVTAMSDTLETAKKAIEDAGLKDQCLANLSRLEEVV